MPGRIEDRADGAGHRIALVPRRDHHADELRKPPAPTGRRAASERKMTRGTT
jgi:hypothetical protein